MNKFAPMGPVTESGDEVLGKSKKSSDSNLQQDESCLKISLDEKSWEEAHSVVLAEELEGEVHGTWVLQGD